MKHFIPAATLAAMLTIGACQKTVTAEPAETPAAATEPGVPAPIANPPMTGESLPATPPIAPTDPTTQPSAPGEAPPR